MARQHRIEYAGALYRVMARGDRHEPIVRDDKDRLRFISTLGEVCCRTGFVVHAYVLLDNHYHLALETPEGNLVDGMRWLQNTYTRRYNVRHNVWGHLFGGRYKALLVEEQDPGYLRCLIDYIHLNVVRAGLVEPDGRLEAFPWSSLREYVMAPGHRSGWLSVERGMSVVGLQDNARDRRKYLERLVAQVRLTNSCDAGLVNTKGLGLSLQNTIRRGWYFGSQEFMEKLLRLSGEDLADRKAKIADGYGGTQMEAHGELRARQILASGLKMFNLDASEISRLPYNDERKLAIASAIQSETSMRLDWIRNELKMGTRAYCSQLITRYKVRERNSPKLLANKMRLLEIERSTD